MKDRLSKYPGRVKLTPVAGQADTFDMIRADEPEEAGTPLNKNSLLRDETAEAIGLDPTSDPTPDDAFGKLAEKCDIKAGDITETIRTDLGDNWVLCNGDVVPEGEYPELREVLPYNTEYRRVNLNAQYLQPESFTPIGIKVYTNIRPLPVAGKWVFWDRAWSNDASKGKKAYVYDVIAETYTEVSCPKIDATNTYGICGMTHDGESYVLGVGEYTEKKLYLYKSTDLKTWVLAYKIDTYCPDEIYYDGTYFMTQVVQGGNNYVRRLDVENNKVTELVANGEGKAMYFIPMPAGYWAYKYYGKNSGTLRVYKTGATSYTSFGSSSTYAGTMVLFNDTKLVYLPTSGGSIESIGIYDISTDTKKTLSVSKLFTVYSSAYSYLYYAEYMPDTNEWVFYLSNYYGSSYSNYKKYYAAYISAESDPIEPTNYRLVQIDALPTDLAYELVSLDRSVLKVESDSVRYIRDPNQKYLPTHDGETYKYIYAGGTPSLTKDGLIMYCDGINNTGGGHDATVTTWKDLSRHGNDLINVGSITATEPSATLRGEWLDDGMHVIRSQNQILRTVNEFEFGTDRTIEFRFTANADAYMTFGLYYGDRVKYRKSNERFWVRFGESENTSAYDVNTGKKSVHNIPTTVTMSRQYNAATDTTLCKAYVDGVYCGEKAFGGNYRDSESGFVYIGSEQLNLTMHAVRVYDRALTDEEIMNNYKYDDYHFDAAKGDADE